MKRWIATKTLDAIDAAICADGGNAYRRNLGLVLPHIGDAYREDEDEYRSHLGGSVIGGKCARAVAYGFRWALKKKPRGKKNEPKQKAESRMRRLWNRGHMEEGRFIALLLTAGIQVYQQDENGDQYRIANYGGHFSGSLDGILLGIPDLPAGVPALGEFKTHSDKSFEELKEDGVRVAKPEHYVQMQQYMYHRGLLYALYLAVNKNTDELYAEIVQLDQPVAESFLKLAGQIIFAPTLPERIRSASPAYFQCKYMCDYPDVCFSAVKPDRNCRTCAHIVFHENGTILCGNPIQIDKAAMQGWEDPIDLDKQAQIEACEDYELHPMFK